MYSPEVLEAFFDLAKKQNPEELNKIGFIRWATYTLLNRSDLEQQWFLFEMCEKLKYSKSKQNTLLELNPNDWPNELKLNIYNTYGPGLPGADFARDMQEMMGRYRERRLKPKNFKE